MAKIKEVIATTASTHNVLVSGTRLIGDIYSDEDFRIDGTIEGNIVCKGKFIIGRNSSITGNIECTNIEVLGKITGNILCTENIILRASAIMTGDIATSSIEIEPGVKFEGKCSMYKAEEQ